MKEAGPEHQPRALRILRTHGIWNSSLGLASVVCVRHWKTNENFGLTCDWSSVYVRKSWDQLSVASGPAFDVQSRTWPSSDQTGRNREKQGETRACSQQACWLMGLFYPWILAGRNGALGCPRRASAGEGDPICSDKCNSLHFHFTSDAPSWDGLQKEILCHTASPHAGHFRVL